MGTAPVSKRMARLSLCIPVPEKLQKSMEQIRKDAIPAILSRLFRQKAEKK